MDSSSGASTESFSQLINSGSDEDLQALMNLKKRKRMLSNRESARRSRMRKQMHVDDLMAQLNQLRNENSQIRTNLNFYTQQYLGMEAENSVHRTQVMELTSRLDSLTEILQYMNFNSSSVHPWMMVSECFTNPCNSLLTSQPIMASPNMLQYY